MNVLHVINGLSGGGAERQLVSLVTGLDPDRFRCEVAVLAPGGLHRSALEAAEIPVHVFVRRGRLSVGFLPGLVQCARRFDIVHAWLTPAILFGLTAARMAGVPVRIGAERGSGYLPPRRLHRALYGLESRALRGATGVIANSRAGADLAASRGVERDRLEVVPNGLPPGWPPACRPRAETRRALGLDPSRLVMVVGASLTPKKDHAGLLTALARLREYTHVRPIVLLAGDGPLRAGLEAQADRLGLTGRVRFLGYRTDIPDLLAAADLAVLPSREREGCSNFLVEAMSLGVPVLTTDAGGSAELVEDGVHGRVVPAADPDALARGFAELLESRELRSRMAASARDHAHERFSRAVMISRIEALYERWLGGETR